MATAQPVGQLLWIMAHFGSKLFQRQPLDLLVPSQSPHQIFGAGDRVVAEEINDFRHAIQGDRRPTIFPIPDGRGRHPNLQCDIFLVQSKLKAATTKVIAESNGFFDEFFRWLDLKGNFDFMRSFL